MQQLIHTKADEWERIFIDFIAKDWKPSFGFDATGRTQWNIDKDLENIPTRQFPLSHLSDALYPSYIYLSIILIGNIIFALNKSKKPLIPSSLLYTLKFVYNFTQIFLCGYMSMETFVLYSRAQFNLIPLQQSECNTFNFHEPRMANLLWIFYCSKLLDYCDTVFIILGNKRAQFNFLHQFHHFSIVWVFWLNLNLCYDGGIFLPIGINAAVHTIMYSYYLISMHVPKVIDPITNKPKYNVWWKRYLTIFQMTQFCLLILQAINVVILDCRECSPRVLQYYLAYTFLMLALFMNLYRSSYRPKRIVPTNTKKKQKKRN